MKGFRLAMLFRKTAKPLREAYFFDLHLLT